MKKQFIKIGYMDTREKKSMKKLTREVLHELMTSAVAYELMARIEAEPDPEKKNLLKNQLPVVFFACQLTPTGERPTQTNRLAVPTGLCMHDWDKMPVSPSQFYFENLAGKEKALGIVMAHVTPRGAGLRLVTEMRPGESIAACQARWASDFGMVANADPKVKDMTRVSFLPSKDYLLYLDEAGLFDRPLNTIPQQQTTLAPSQNEIDAQQTALAPSQNVIPEQQDTLAPSQNVISVQQDALAPSQNVIDAQQSSLAHLQDVFVAQQTALAPSQNVIPQQQSALAPVQYNNVREQNDIQPMNGQSTNVADNFSYCGIKYSLIIEALLKRLATQGTVREGERNNTLFMLTRELRHICEYNFHTIYMLTAPYFSTLPDAEIRRTIGSAIATNGRTITPLMRGVLSELKNENIEQVDVTDAVLTSKLPKVSPIEEEIMSHYPKEFRTQVYLAMMPIWGMYASGARFDFMNGRENSLSFMTAVVGKSGSGKAFAAHLAEQMTERIALQDALERKKADEYLAICNKASDEAEKPDDPRPKVRIYGDDITTSQLLEYLDNLNGLHGFQFTEEVARLVQAKKSFYGNNDDLYCKAFDNGVGGKESKSKQTRNIRIPIYLNTLLCGTSGAMHKFFSNPEGGLNNRIIYAYMPNRRIKGFPRYEKFGDELKTKLNETYDRLQAIKPGDAKIELAWLEREVTMIKNRWDKEDDENPDEVWYDLGKRALILAMRDGVKEWLLRGCPGPEDKKQIREICRLVRWTAEYIRAAAYAFSGKEYEEINAIDNALQLSQNQSRQTKNKKLFSLLPDEFTTQELIALRVQNGASTNVSMVLSRWVADGLIRKVGDGRYQKMAEAA